MQRVASFCRYHPHAAPVGGLYDLRVALGAAGLNDGLYAGIREDLKTVGERKEGVASRHGPRSPLARIFYRDLCRGHAASLTRSDADRSPVTGEPAGMALPPPGDPPALRR